MIKKLFSFAIITLCLSHNLIHAMEEELWDTLLEQQQREKNEHHNNSPQAELQSATMEPKEADSIQQDLQEVDRLMELIQMDLNNFSG